ncbi:MAG TPA: amidophosphoribosyltransferase [Candidatus Saccharimonadales bacterium]|nr:amidophosphoribosyltransferase [Candidatus Saccharimonadales bacterium]
MRLANRLADSGVVGDRLTEKCGVFGVYCPGAEAARLTYYGLWALQHRGQESSGIVSTNGQNLYDHIRSGLVAHAYADEDFDYLQGHLAIGHNRYATSGGARECHSQPVIGPNKTFAFSHNGNLPTTTELEAFLASHNVATDDLNDSEMMAAAIKYYTDQGLSLEQAVAAAYPLFQGAFSCLVMDRHKMVAFRDECGIRPLSIGTLDGGWVVSSETCAFDTIGAAYLRDVRPGEMVVIDASGLKTHKLAAARPKLDIFEFVYFARPDSFIMRRRVNEVRRKMGVNLAREHALKADVVVAVPDSAIPAALGYAQASGIRFDHGLIKNRYIHRTFIRPTQSLRERDVKMKLNPLPEALMGKRVIVVDDSIVRGTTTKQIVQMMYGAGAKEVHLLVSSPPVKFPDFYGINTPRQADLIAARLGIGQIRDEVGADSLGYLSYDGMIAATGRSAKNFSTACFDGVYPINIAERANEVLQVA